MSIINCRRQENSLTFFWCKQRERERRVKNKFAHGDLALASENCRGRVGGKGYSIDAVFGMAQVMLYLQLLVISFHICTAFRNILKKELFENDGVV